MLLPALTGFGLPAFVMLKSACPADATAMLEVAVLLLVLVSLLVVETVAVSVMMVPDAVPPFTV